MGHGVNLDIHGLTYLHPFELRFFEIGQNPDAVFDHGHLRLPNRQPVAALNTFLRDSAGNRCDYRTVGKLQLAIADSRFAN